MKETTAAGVAKRLNKAAAKKNPLLAATGTLEDIKPTVTPEQVIEKHDRSQSVAQKQGEQLRANSVADLEKRVEQAHKYIGVDRTEACIEYARSCISMDPAYATDMLLGEIAKEIGATPLDAYYIIEELPNPYKAYAEAHPKPEEEQGRF